MIIDFGCREAPGYLGSIASALFGAISVLVVVGGLAFIGRLVTRSAVSRASDVFVGWGIVAGIMTLAAVLFSKPLLVSACGIYILMFIGFVYCLKGRKFITPFWVLALFPGLFVLTAINIIGLGGFAYDDFSHWVPNALYVFVHDDVPSKTIPSLHSIYPGYPYALPFLTYLASLIAGGFLVQGGAMINFVLLVAFAAMLVETTNKQGSLFFDKQPITWHIISLSTLVLIFGAFFNSSMSTFGITNQGDAATMVLCGALGLFLWKLTEALAVKDKTNIRDLSLRLTLIAVAFVLTKQSNVILLAFLIIAFLVIAFRGGVLKSAYMSLPLIILPALMLRLIWSYYVSIEIVGGEVSTTPLAAWKFDLFLPLLKGIWYEIEWKPVFFVLFVGTQACGVYSLFRPQMSWRNFALFAAIVQMCYAIFLIVAFLGSDFTEYTIRYAASFHRYMLHAAFLALPTFWFLAQALFESMKEKRLSFSVSLNAQRGVTLLLLVVLPFVAVVKTDWIAVRPNTGMCTVQNFGRKVAANFPDKTQLGAIFPGDNGLMAFIIGFELALEEAKTGRSMMMSWHSDNFHTFISPQPADVEQKLKEHPETDALVYTSKGYTLIESLGLKNELGTGLLVREGNEWKPKLIYLP